MTLQIGRGRLTAVLLAVLALCAAVVALAGTAQAEIKYLSSFGEPAPIVGKGGQFNRPAGIAINNSNGDVYVADRNQNRIQQFTETGGFIRAWGFGVVKSGPDNNPLNEVQNLTIRADSGNYQLSFARKATGIGKVTKNNKTITGVATTSGAFVIGQQISGSGIAAGSTITSVGATTIGVSINPTASVAESNLTATLTATTGAIASGATAGTVQTALNGLLSVSAGGGSVTVTGGPGDASGSTPYAVAFTGGPLADFNVEALEIQSQSNLGLPVGTELTCTNSTSATTKSVQWLRNGAQIVGANSTAYTVAPVDAGAQIQCQAFGINANSGATGVSNGTLIASPVPVTAAPGAPGFIPQPEQSAAIEVPGPAAARTLTCQAGSWTGAPLFSYQWYKNGAAILGATESTYMVAAGSLGDPAAYQCAITGTNAGGAVTRISESRQTTPGPVGPTVPFVNPNVNRPAAATSTVTTSMSGGEIFEVCTPADVCAPGRAGAQTGELNAPRGIAVDNSSGGSGEVYVVDDNNFRVQKFSSTGTPILMFGGEVDKTGPSDICTVASGDTCGIGVENTGQVPGRFGRWPTQTELLEFRELGNPVTTDSAGNVYVADVRSRGEEEARIEKFAPSGTFLGQVRIPGGNPSPTFYSRPVSLGVDSAGRVFTSVTRKPAIAWFEPSELGLADIGPLFGERKEFDRDLEPRQVAISPNDDKIWVSDENPGQKHFCGGEGTSRRAIMAFDAKGRRVECSEPAGEGQLAEVTGMAISPDGKTAYVSAGSVNKVKVFELPTPQAPVVVGGERARNITTTTAKLRADVNPGFEYTSYSFEYGAEDCEVGPCEEVEGADDLNGLENAVAEVKLAGLDPNTTYHYRVVASSRFGTDTGTDHTFRTFALVDLSNDPCPNALARKQTATASLADCRAYELASAEFTGGYDVESDLIPGQTPFGGTPQVDDKLLYAVHDGGIPGTGKPTNRGPDPYVAVRDRDEERWTTKYVGIPADAPSTTPFSSTVSGFDDDLTTFAFGGSKICDPCFGDGSAGNPLHMSDGSLIQGMAGSIPVANPVAAGEVLKPISADGTRFVFGSTQMFEPGANESGTDVTIYARDLSAGATEIVSTLPDGSTIEAGEDVAELDISDDGSRVLIGQLVATDGEGNSLWHLYMHVAGTSESIDLTPGTTSGVLYAGMSDDGTAVFFTTRDPLNDDNDTSVDLYRSGGGGLPTRISTGASAGDTDACDPSANSYNVDDWNTIPGGPTDCSVVAIGGGGGVAVQNGSIYFLSPETLDGNGVDGAPNMFLARPGEEPKFVATLESSASSPLLRTGPHTPDSSFGSFDYAEGVAIDPLSRSTYVLDNDHTEFGPGAYVQKFDSSGAPDNSFGTASKITGAQAPCEEFAQAGVGPEFGFAVGWPLSVAVDPVTGSPSYRDLYVPDYFHLTVWKFSPSGTCLGGLALADAPTGVAVNPANGDVYIAGLFGTVSVFSASGASKPGFAIPAERPTDIAVDSTGRVYLADTISTKIYEGGILTGVLDPNPSYGVKVDPLNDNAYVDEGTRVVEFNSSGKSAGVAIGAGELSGSASLAVDSEHVAVSNVTEVRTYLPREVAKDSHYDNPLVIDGVRDADTRHLADFQTTPSGEHAAFPTTMPLTGYDSAGKYQVYRYDAPEDQIGCASCLPTEGLPDSDSSLPSNGLGLTDDGRVFFNSRDQLVLKDTNEKLDAYEWKGGNQTLISTGNSIADSGLLSVTADGKDAFFFTRDTLVPNDVNGQTMKVYDARELGGFFKIPGTQPCAASDECHGPGTQSAPPPPIGTFKGSGGQFTPIRCKKGFVKKQGKCVRKKRKGHHGKKKGKRAAGSGRRGNR